MSDSQDITKSIEELSKKSSFYETIFKSQEKFLYPQVMKLLDQMIEEALLSPQFAQSTTSKWFTEKQELVKPAGNPIQHSMDALSETAERHRTHREEQSRAFPGYAIHPKCRDGYHRKCNAWFIYYAGNTMRECKLICYCQCHEREPASITTFLKEAPALIEKVKQS